MNIGDELTIEHEIIDSSGGILFSKGEKVIISYIDRDISHWSMLRGGYTPEKICGVKLEGHYGTWFLNCFEETKKI